MTTAQRPGKERMHARPGRRWNEPAALPRTTSLDTLATSIPTRIRVIPRSGNRGLASVRIDLPEATVVRLLVLDRNEELVHVPMEGWLPAGTHELRDLPVADGTYKLRLETPTTWYVAGIIIG